MDRNELFKLAQLGNCVRKERIITLDDVDFFLGLLEEHKDNPKVKRIRVYPELSRFVPHSYKWRADVTMLEANRSDDGEWHIQTGTVDAHRAFGQGPRVTINGRAA